MNHKRSETSTECRSIWIPTEDDLAEVKVGRESSQESIHRCLAFASGSVATTSVDASKETLHLGMQSVVELVSVDTSLNVVDVSTHNSNHGIV